MSHNLNSITLEVNAATDLVDRENFATVFAIHNRYIGAGDEQKPREKAVPISVLFGRNTLNLARKTIRKGSRFTVIGALDHDRSDDGKKEFFTIRADSLSPYPKSSAAEAGAGAKLSPASSKRQRPATAGSRP